MAKFEVKISKKCVNEMTVVVEAETRAVAMEEALRFATDPLVVNKKWDSIGVEAPQVVWVKVKLK